MLFEDKPRNRTAPMKDGEREFDFYDSSARPEYTFYRQLLNGWIAALPLSEREEMISRLKKGTSLEYQAALSELTIHAALKRQGCSVEIHPLCEHPTRRPDFLARNEEGERLAFIEVTSFRPRDFSDSALNCECAPLQCFRHSRPTKCTVTTEEMVKDYEISQRGL